jgi:hypothetical protein
MTRLELLQVVIAQARANGFPFKKWYVSRIGLPWTSAQEAVASLSTERRYYALLFSHEFASNFWKAGEQMTFQVTKQTFPRAMADGSVRLVTRKAHIRRSAREDVWRYHLREMAVAEEPLRYIRRFVRVAEELDETDESEI